jgi:glycosyltransferase involved in cell wall biosynthesis
MGGRQSGYIKKSKYFKYGKSILPETIPTVKLITKQQPIISESANERDNLKIFGSLFPVLNENFGINRDNFIYCKKIFVDYDVVICIPSYNRYKRVRRLISQFYKQPTKYTFKIILLNDGSTGGWYNKLAKEFPETIYLKNKTPNGKVLHWYCYNQMWEKLKEIMCHTVLQMDDDFILSDNFLNTIVDLFFKAKENNGSIMAIAPHLWSFKKEGRNENWWSRTDFVDGIALIDEAVIKYMNYEMKPVDADAVSKAGAPVRAWTQIGQAIKNMNCIIYRTPESLVYHDGNDDSKLHGDVRKLGKGGVYTQKYIGKI